MAFMNPKLAELETQVSKLSADKALIEGRIEELTSENRELIEKLASYELTEKLMKENEEVEAKIKSLADSIGFTGNIKSILVTENSKISYEGSLTNMVKTLKIVSEVEHQDFVAKANPTVGTGADEDNSPDDPKSIDEALLSVQKANPKMNARQRVEEAQTLYPKLWNK
jgi:hypothetical protein